MHFAVRCTKRRAFASLRQIQGKYRPIVKDRRFRPLEVEGQVPATQKSGAPADIFASLLKQHGNTKSVSSIKKVHLQIIESGLDGDRFLGNNLVQVYGKCGNVEDARAVFDRIRQKNVFSWTIMISAYAQNGHGKEALDLFRQMDREGMRPNEVTFATALGICSSMKSLADGRAIHARLLSTDLKPDLVIGNALVNMYSKCGSLSDARRAFDEMPRRDVVSWTTMITAYWEHGYWKQTLQLFWEMQSKGVAANEITCLSILGACSCLGDLADAKALHDHIVTTGLDSRLVVANSLVYTYGKCGSPKDARNVFDSMQKKNAVSWTSMITAYTQNDQAKAALELFQKMEAGQEDVKLDDITFLTALEACSSMAALEEGKAVHAVISASGYEADVVVGTAIVNMYNKCGSLDDARSMFDRMPVRNVVSWNAIMGAYTQHGDFREALELFKFSGLEGILPDDVSFISILFACSHGGLMKEGRSYFLSIEVDYGIVPTADHYTCMVNLLGRAGWLADAENLINTMPFESDFVAWMTLLAGCKMHADVKRGARVADRLSSVEPRHGAPFVLLSNIYAEADDSVRKAMKDRGCFKQIGHSFIQVDKRVHEFSHERLNELMKDTFQTRRWSA